MDLIKRVPLKIKESCFLIVVAVGGVWIARKVAHGISNHLSKKATERTLAKWASTPKNVVILHTIPRGKTVPNLSPFVMKLETFLRMTKIPYQMDYESPWSAKGKTPWITFNGEHVADSQLIIEFLNTKAHKITNSYSKEEKAVAHAVRVMMDEHFYWGLGLWRYVYSGGQGLSEIFALPPPALKVFFKSANARVKTASWWQGVGRHDQELVVQTMNKNLEAVSLILGSNNKPYLLGDAPCEEDCAVFGFLSQVLWGAPGSPYTAFVKEKLPNLVEYCDHMKATYWPDWDACLADQNKRQ